MKFQWDEFNTHKIRIKHGVSKKEAESVFKDADRKIFFTRMKDGEMRYICIRISRTKKLRAAAYTR